MWVEAVVEAVISQRQHFHHPIPRCLFGQQPSLLWSTSFFPLSLFHVCCAHTHTLTPAHTLHAMTSKEFSTQQQENIAASRAVSCSMVGCQTPLSSSNLLLFCSFLKSFSNTRAQKPLLHGCSAHHFQVCECVRSHKHKHGWKQHRAKTQWIRGMLILWECAPSLLRSYTVSHTHTHTLLHLCFSSCLICSLFRAHSSQKSCMHKLRTALPLYITGLLHKCKPSPLPSPSCCPDVCLLCSLIRSGEDVTGRENKSYFIYRNESGPWKYFHPSLLQTCLAEFLQCQNFCRVVC